MSTGAERASRNGTRADPVARWQRACLVSVLLVHLALLALGLFGGNASSVTRETVWLAASALTAMAIVLALRFGGSRGMQEKNQQLELANKKLEDINVLLKDHIVWRKKIEAERQRIIDELEAKNAEMERFTYTVSHDLKSPLITIRGFLGLVEQDIAAGEFDRMRGDMERIEAAIGKMGQLLDELLELSRIGRLVNPPQEVSMVDLGREAAELAAGRIDARGVEVDIAPDLPPAFGDRPRLLEVAQNLIENAVKFMGDQPRPRVEMGHERRDEEEVYFVRDNGVGIEARYHDRVFGLFQRLDQSVEGTGIGLALVKRIIEVHGGRIWVESEGRRRGSAFCFTLPRPEVENGSALLSEPASRRHPAEIS